MGLLNWIAEKWLGWFLEFNPRPDCLKAIESSHYDSETNACRHKSREAYKCLDKSGHKVRVVSGPVKGLVGYHVWIELEHKGEVYWYDPTWYSSNPFKYGCHLAELWRDREVVRV